MEENTTLKEKVISYNSKCIDMSIKISKLKDKERKYENYSKANRENKLHI